MTWTKTSRQTTQQNFKKNLLFIGLPIILLALGLYLGLVIFHLGQRPERIAKIEPAKIIEIKEPFSGNVFFNDELGVDNLSKIIIGGLDSAQSSVDLAMYSLDSATIKDSIYRAAKRGVAVNLIFSDKHETGLKNIFKTADNNIKISFIPSDNGYMHHKFLLIDRGEASQKLFFGSYNFTDIQGKYDPSFILETGRPELVNIFGEEFDRLTTGINSADKALSTFNPFAALVKYPEGSLEIWFSPGTDKNNVRDLMLGFIKSSSKNIKVMIWNLTDKNISDALALSSQRVPVSIITDDSNWSADYSVFPALAAYKEQGNLNNLEIITDAKNSEKIKETYAGHSLNSFLHHHLLIIDDRVAVFGTNNWSYNGFFRNDESIMITNINSLVAAFGNSYLTNYNKNK